MVFYWLNECVSNKSIHLYIIYPRSHFYLSWSKTWTCECACLQNFFTTLWKLWLWALWAALWHLFLNVLLDVVMYVLFSSVGRLCITFCFWVSLNHRSKTDMINIQACKPKGIVWHVGKCICSLSVRDQDEKTDTSVMSCLSNRKKDG